ncbi:MAG: hypothetical protein Q9P44_19565 [Anaerolineae bacterium]|nr:hypothetical protein [Anaerolineae bacterium]
MSSVWNASLKIATSGGSGSNGADSIVGNTISVDSAIGVALGNTISVLSALGSDAGVSVGKIASLGSGGTVAISTVGSISVAAMNVAMAGGSSVRASVVGGGG